MKKIIALVLTVICVIGLCSCNPSNVSSPAPESYAFTAQYIRTNGHSDGRSYPYHVVIQSREELEAYYAANKDFFDLARKETVYSNTTIGFLDACDRYNDAYFERQNLVLIVLEEGSGSVRHEITDVRHHGDGSGSFDGWDITINRIVPEVVTCDMAQWHLFLEIQMGNVIGSDDAVWINGKPSECVAIPESSVFPTLSAAKELTQEQLAQLLKGRSMAYLYEVWGEAAYSLSGMYGAVWKADTLNEIIVYDDGTGLITDVFIYQAEGASSGPFSPSSAINPYTQPLLYKLTQKYPEYFSLDTMKGLEVYVWQMAGNLYHCGLLSGTNRMKTPDEIQALMGNGATIDEMKAILSAYGLGQDMIMIYPVYNPVSSYWYEIDSEYQAKIEAMFWED